MRTLKESILTNDFDIDELQEISIELALIYKYAWKHHSNKGWVEANIISPKASQIFDEIVKIIQDIIKLHKNSKLPKVDVFYDERHKMLYIIQKSAGPATGVMFDLFETWGGESQINVCFSWAFNYKTISNAYHFKKIGTVPLAVILDIKEKLQL